MESALERYLVKKVKEIGGMAVKMTPPPRGIPDRLILLPNGITYFVEVKNGAKGRVSEIQAYMHDALRKLGFDVHVVREREDVWKILHLK